MFQPQWNNWTKPTYPTYNCGYDHVPRTGVYQHVGYEATQIRMLNQQKGDFNIFQVIGSLFLGLCKAYVPGMWHSTSIMTWSTSEWPPNIRQLEAYGLAAFVPNHAWKKSMKFGSQIKLAKKMNTQQ